MAETTRIASNVLIDHRIEGEDMVLEPMRGADLARLTPDLAERFVKRVPLKGRIVLDLGRIGSAGSGSLAIAAVAGLRKAAGEQAPLVIRNAQPILANSLRLVGLGSQVTIESISAPHQ
jgi:hypothetical protein